jgi:hypothetical protein
VPTKARDQILTSTTGPPRSIPATRPPQKNEGGEVRQAPVSRFRWEDYKMTGICNVSNLLIRLGLFVINHIFPPTNTDQPLNARASGELTQLVRSQLTHRPTAQLHEYSGDWQVASTCTAGYTITHQQQTSGRVLDTVTSRQSRHSQDQAGSARCDRMESWTTSRAVRDPVPTP